MKNRRIGNIEIPVRIINDEPWLARCIMSRMIVVRAEHLYTVDAIVYTVLCDEFDENPYSGVLPDYDILVSVVDGVVFKKTPSKGFTPRFDYDAV